MENFAENYYPKDINEDFLSNSNNENIASSSQSNPQSPFSPEMLLGMLGGTGQNLFSSLFSNQNTPNDILMKTFSNLLGQKESQPQQKKSLDDDFFEEY